MSRSCTIHSIQTTSLWKTKTSITTWAFLWRVTIYELWIDIMANHIAKLHDRLKNKLFSRNSHGILPSASECPCQFHGVVGFDPTPETTCWSSPPHYKVDRWITESSKYLRKDDSKINDKNPKRKFVVTRNLSAGETELRNPYHILVAIWLSEMLYVFMDGFHATRTLPCLNVPAF